MAHTLTTCTFCGVGCGLYLETAGDRIVGAYPSVSHPTNQGRICVRGWHVHEIAGAPDRLRTPLIRVHGRFTEVSWEEALGYIVERLTAVCRKHGPNALAFLNSPRCSNEESYLLQKVARAVIGTNNVDHGAGVYCNNSIKVLLQMLGVAASTSSVADIDASDVIVVDGVDLARQLPTIGGRVIRAKLKGARLIVIDSRRHRVAESADTFLQIRPGTEAHLYGAMSKVAVDHGLMNLPFVKSRCRNYDEFLANLDHYDLLATADVCGVPAEQIEDAALAYARANASSILYSTGIEARSAESIQALVDLALLTGQLGKPGAGIFALTEHNNLQGVCDMGMLPDRLPGYRAVACAAERAELERHWGADLPATPGLDSRSLLSRSNNGKLKAAWLCRYDPVGSAFFGDAADVLDECELVVAQHVFMSSSAKHAHVVLPTVAYGEERVSFTSTDRRIQLAEKVVDASPGVLPAWQQLAEVGKAMGADWHYGSSADVMAEIGQVVPFYSGANYANLGRDYGRQWPCTSDRPLGSPRLFEDGSAGKPGFRFVAVPRPPIEAAEDCFPLTLVFGHSLYYWHRNVTINHSETLKREYRLLLMDYPDGFVDVNVEDAKELGIRDGQKIKLCAEGGCAVTTARVTSEVRKGMVLVPFFVREVQREIRGTSENGVTLVPVRVEKEAA